MTEREEGFSLAGRVESFGHALRGLVELVRTQHNARIHLLATVCVVALGLALGVSALQWCLLVLAIIAVWVAEALNTALEYLCDAVSPDFHPLVKQAKDIAAGGVLVSAIGAATIGCIVFLPFLLALC